jgi:hypothetical protein
VEGRSYGTDIHSENKEDHQVWGKGDDLELIVLEQEIDAKKQRI